MIIKREVQIRFKAFTFLSVAISTIFTIYGFYSLFIGKEVLAALELISSSLLIFNFIYFLISKRYSFCSTALLAIVGFNFIALFITGEFGKPGIFWVFLYPLLTVLLKEPGRALKWSLAFLFLLIVSYLIIPLPYSPTVVEQAFLVYFLVLAFSYFYSKSYGELLNDIKALAVKDPLTNLYNRAFAISYLNQELEKLKRKELNNICVAYIDLDNFKAVNDRFGHSVGDRVLKELGRLLREYFRKEDVVARIGGDEFIVIFTNCDRKSIEDRLKLLRKKIEDEFGKFGISMSFGLAEAPKDGLSSEILIKTSDERMYNDKRLRKVEDRTSTL